MKAWQLLTISLLLLLGVSPQHAWAADEDGPASAATQQQLAPLPTAESLGLIETEEAALLITSADEVQRVTLASRTIDPSLRPFLVRNLKEGLLSLQIESPERIWEGSVRLYAGRLTSFDAAVALASSEAHEREAEAFDLFDFYDRMDRLSSLVAKLAWCQTILLDPPAAPDDTLVEDLCSRLQRQADLAAERDASSSDLDDGELEGALLDAPEEETERRITALQKLYRADGRVRQHAPGTAFRLGISGLGFAGSALGAGVAVAFEIQAEREYLLYRSSERVGDDPAMTRHLFVTQDLDRRRDGAIGLAVASLTTGIVAALFQRLETKRFKRYRASLESGKEVGNE